MEKYYEFISTSIVLLAIIIFILSLGFILFGNYLPNGIILLFPIDITHWFTRCVITSPIIVVHILLINIEIYIHTQYLKSKYKI